MNVDFDQTQADQDSIDGLIKLVEQERNMTSDLLTVIHKQDFVIQKLRGRLSEHGIHVLEKSIVETSREELAKINKSVPPCRTARAKNPYKKPIPPHETTTAQYKQQAADRYTSMIAGFSHVFEGIDLEQYGIDPKTMLFKPGWGPDGKIPEPLTFWQKFKLLFT